MTRCEDCESMGIFQFSLRDQVIASPGKFEGEPLYVVHFYHMMLDGMGEVQYEQCPYCEEELDACEDFQTTWFTITQEDVDMFGVVGLTADLIGKRIGLEVDERGFVYSIIEEKEING